MFEVKNLIYENFMKVKLEGSFEVSGIKVLFIFLSFKETF
jgi:hypothetical protein